MAEWGNLDRAKVSLLINFNARVVKDGIRLVVNDFSDSPRSLWTQL